MSQKFHQWLTAYQDDAWSLASYLLKDRAEAEDVTQEAFIKLWNQRESIPCERVKPWLLTVVRNACLDRLRHLQIVKPFNDTEVPSPEAVAEQHEIGAWLRQAIAGPATVISLISGSYQPMPARPLTNITWPSPPCSSRNRGLKPFVSAPVATIP